GRRKRGVANAAGFIIQSFAIPMVFVLGGGNNARGYLLTMAIFSTISVTLFLFCFSVTKERIQPDPRQKSSVVQDLGDLAGNGPWIALFLATLFYFVALSIRSSVMLPYFKYCAGNQILFSWFNGFGLLALITGVAFSHMLTLRFSKRNVFFWSVVLTGLFSMSLLWIPTSATALIILSEVLRQLSSGCSGPVLWAMMADVADFGEWKTGRRATATVTSAVVFALWVGLALGGAMTGWMFSFFGYQPNLAQTAHTLLGIRLISSLCAGLVYLAASVCLLFYGIDRKQNMEISRDLRERRKYYMHPNQS
ncbi:MAG TPA: MFS transporter, partial [Terracidiphilus sp.]|nr:MFS transporter [Terracidiphilus sp.]